MTGFSILSQRSSHEAHLSTLGRAQEAHSWFPCPHAHPGRAGGHSRAPGQGPRPSWRLSARHRFGRNQRLRAAAVTAALKYGSVRRNPRFRVSTRANALAYGRLAVIVPKRFAAHAVVRNRIRRLIREVFRTRPVEFSGRDVVVRLTSSLGDRAVTFAEVSALLVNDGRA